MRSWRLSASTYGYGWSLAWFSCLWWSASSSCSSASAYQEKEVGLNLYSAPATKYWTSLHLHINDIHFYRFFPVLTQIYSLPLLIAEMLNWNPDKRNVKTLCNKCLGALESAWRCFPVSLCRKVHFRNGVCPFGCVSCQTAFLRCGHTETGRVVQEPMPFFLYTLCTPCSQTVQYFCHSYLLFLGMTAILSHVC